MSVSKECAYLSIGQCKCKENPVELKKCGNCNRVLHHLCQTEYAAAMGLEEKSLMHICCSKECMSKCYYIRPQHNSQPALDVSPAPATPAPTTTQQHDTPAPTTTTTKKLKKPDHTWTSIYWKHFMVVVGEEKTAQCSLCGDGIKFKNGTGGLKNHLNYKHNNEYKALHDKTETLKSETPSKNHTIEQFGFKTRPKPKELAVRVELYRQAVTAWAIEANIALSKVAAPSFRRIVDVAVPPNEKGKFIITQQNVRERITELGSLTRKATKIEMKNKIMAYTTDHWTGPNGKTYTTLTGHWIEDWIMKSNIMDFKVFHGRTRGEDIKLDLDETFEYYELDEENTTMIVSDTTGNMNTFGDKLREEGGCEHGYCFDHNIQRNTILAYKGDYYVFCYHFLILLLLKYLQIITHIVIILYFIYFSSDTNLPGAEGTMRTARALVEYFNKSTQATSKLLKFQENSSIPKYKERKKPLKLLQDVETRWWSTLRMDKRLCFLKEAVKGLHTSDEIDCKMLDDNQWHTMVELNEVLGVPGEVQKTVEGEMYPTSPLLPFSLFLIRKNYSDKSNNRSTSPPIKHLSKVLLEDLDRRYVPHPDKEGSVQYLPVARKGKYNRYYTLHLFVFYAAFLDPRTKVNLKEIMVEKNYDELANDILEELVKLKKQELENNNNNNHDRVDNSYLSPQKKKRKTTTKNNSLYKALNKKDVTDENVAQDSPLNNEEIKADCEREMKIFMSDSVSLDMNDEKTDEFNDPLQWWKKNEPKYETLAKMAKKYLCIPAASAPSERIWSRSSSILSMKRSRLSDDVASDIMFIRENIDLLNKHYTSLTGKEEIILPMIHESEDVYDKDVGQGEV